MTARFKAQVTSGDAFSRGFQDALKLKHSPGARSVRSQPCQAQTFFNTKKKIKKNK